MSGARRAARPAHPAMHRAFAAGAHYPGRLLAAMAAVFFAAAFAAGPEDAPLPAGAAREAGAVADPLEVRVTVRAEPARVTVGDPVVVSVEIRYPDGAEVASPAPGQQWGSLTVAGVERGEPRRHLDGGWVRVDRLRAAAFAPGAAKAPALELEYRAPDGSVGKVATPPLEVAVESVLRPGEPPEIADLKDPASLPRPLWPWAAGAAAALAAAAAAAWLLYRRRLLAALAQREEGASLPPHEWALQRLAALARSDLLAAGRWLDYHVIVAEVVKEYLSRRFRVPTLERTTSEVLVDARAARLGSGVVADLGSILEPCDLVKFARHRAARAEAEALLARARAFVEATRPVEVAPAPAAAGSPGA